MITYDGWLIAKEKLLEIMEKSDNFFYIHVYEKNPAYEGLNVCVGTIYRHHITMIQYQDDGSLSYGYETYGEKYVRELRLYEHCNGVLFVIEQRSLGEGPEFVTYSAFIVFSDNTVSELNLSEDYLTMFDQLEAA